MTIYVITGSDTLTLFDRVFADFADDDVSTFTFPNDLVTMKTGKNRNTIYSQNEPGANADGVLRIIRGSSDDQFLQGKLLEMGQDFVSSILAAGQFVKRLGDGEGNVIRDVVTLAGGVFTREVDTKANASGDTIQGVAIYNMKFAQATRSMQ